MMAQTASGDFCHLLTTFAKSLDSTFCEIQSEFYFFDSFVFFLREFFSYFLQKLMSKTNLQMLKKHEKLTSMQVTTL